MSSIHLKTEGAGNHNQKHEQQVVPLQINRKHVEGLFNAPRLVQQMIHAGWIQTVRKGKPGRSTLFDYESAREAYRRLQQGEQPALLPCEHMRERKREHQGHQKGGNAR